MDDGLEIMRSAQTMQDIVFYRGERVHMLRRPDLEKAAAYSLNGFETYIVPHRCSRKELLHIVQTYAQREEMARRVQMQRGR